MTTAPDPTPLTDEELNAIEAHAAQLHTSIGGEYRIHADLARDVPRLIATIDHAARAARADALDWAASVWRISRNDEPDQLDPDPAARLQRLAAGVRSGTLDIEQSEVDRLRAENTRLSGRLKEINADYVRAREDMAEVITERNAARAALSETGGTDGP
jgi:hypothetical protein